MFVLSAARMKLKNFFHQEIYFHYNPGDKLINITRNKLKSDFIAEEYVECPYCKKDFFVDIQIKDKVILSITIISKS